jgi:alpha-tubulin suppressor-like RCC1 family protein
VVELKLSDRSAILLSRKGDIYQLGDYYRDGERCFSESPKKVDKLSSVKQIWSGAANFFALSESKGLYGWGDNS